MPDEVDLLDLLAKEEGELGEHGVAVLGEHGRWPRRPRAPVPVALGQVCAARGGWGSRGFVRTHASQPGPRGAHAPWESVVDAKGGAWWGDPPNPRLPCYPQTPIRKGEMGRGARLCPTTGVLLPLSLAMLSDTLRPPASPVATGASDVELMGDWDGEAGGVLSSIATGSSERRFSSPPSPPAPPLDCSCPMVRSIGPALAAKEEEKAANVPSSVRACVVGWLVPRARSFGAGGGGRH
mmetsp:Transcript_26774/g.85968  ORF Transcript_26774/g.85968 Transcript_26774/m.85968 type:complete len:238 (-) Transcript_26774:272-985(-)